MGIYLKKIVKELISLENPGIKIASPFVPAPFLCKVILLVESCDLPAKCLVLNSMQFNGNSGCSKIKTHGSVSCGLRSQCATPVSILTGRTIMRFSLICNFVMLVRNRMIFAVELPPSVPHISNFN